MGIDARHMAGAIAIGIGATAVMDLCENVQEALT